MDIEQAKAIPLYVIFDHMNLKAIRNSRYEYQYFSPLREEKTPSFYLNTKWNVWFDHGTGEGGGVFKFAKLYLKSRNQPAEYPDIYFWLENLIGGQVIFDALPLKDQGPDNPQLKLEEVRPVTHVALIRYLESRGIEYWTASKYLKEIVYTNINTGLEFFALGMKNEDESYEIRSSIFKGCVGNKDITVIRGKNPNGGVHFFEGMMDFLSIVSAKKSGTLDDDAIVLHSLSCMKRSIPYLAQHNYKIACGWLDNDKAGEKAQIALQHILREQQIFEYKSMNDVYGPHKDVNAWHMYKLNLA